MLRVRGAPAIGVAAAFGAYLAARFAPDEQLEGASWPPATRWRPQDRRR